MECPRRHRIAEAGEADGDFVPVYFHASLPFAEIPARRKGHKSDEELLRESPHVTPDGIVHLSTKPEDIMVVVLGGKHRHSVFLPMWTGRNTLSVIKRIG